MPNEKDPREPKRWPKDEPVLGPPDGAIFRTWFPIPTPEEAKKGIQSPEGTTLEELDQTWEAVIREAAEKRQARKDKGG